MLDIAKKNINFSSNLQLLILVAAIVLFYILLKPLLNIFLASIILTYIFYPVYQKIKKPLKYDSLSILITLILIVIIFLMPFVFVASQIPVQVTNIYDYAKENIVSRGFFDFNCENVNSIKCGIFNFLSESGHFNFDEIFDIVFKKIIEIAKYIVVRIPNFVIGIVLALFISFFLFKDGKKLSDNIVKMIPINKKYSNELIEKFGKVAHSVVFAHIIVAIVQGILGAIGLAIFGIGSPIFWGVVMAIFALVPLVGTAVIWAPASIFLFINGLITSSYWDMGKGIGLFLYGLLIISTSDNFLRVKIVGGRGEVHPLIVLIGIIGGINIFGLIGIFVGPIILSLLITLFKEFSGKYNS